MSAFSGRAYLALCAVFDIAWHGSDGAVGAGEVASRLGLSHRGTESLLQQLRHAGIFVSRRGGQGGYRLRDPNMTCGEVVRAVGQDDLRKPGRWPRISATRAVAIGLAPAEESYLAELNTVTLAALCEQARQLDLGAAEASSAEQRYDRGTSPKRLLTSPRSPFSVFKKRGLSPKRRP